MCLAFCEIAPLPLRLNRLFAYLGRYAHQSVAVMQQMTVSELRLLARCTADILEDERKAGNVPES